MVNKLNIFIFFLTCCVTIVSGAQSQTLGVPSIGDGIFAYFTTELGDIRTAKLLNQIFGPLYLSSNGGVSSTPFSILIGFINLIVLSIGGILLIYNITAGLLQSAYEGEMLGRRWSSLWAPLRVLFAVALLIPIPNLGGYNVIQGGVAWITRGATLLASELWSQGSSVVLSGEIPLTGISPKIDSELIGVIYRNQLCMWLANYQFEVARSSLRVTFVFDTNVETPIIVSAVNGSREEICGSYRLPKTPDYINRLGTLAAVVESRFRNMHVAILQQLIEDVDSIIARQWPILIANEGSLPPIADLIAVAVNTANSRLSTESEALLTSVSSSVNKSKDARQELLMQLTNTDCHNEGFLSNSTSCGGNGWISAGSWHMMIARLNAEIMGLLNARPTAKESRYLSDSLNRFSQQIVTAADDTSWLQRIFSAKNNNKYLHLNEARRIWHTAITQFTQSATRLSVLDVRISGKLLQDAAPVGRSGLLGRIWEIGFADAAGAMINTFSPSNWADDPIVGIVRMGNVYLDIAGALIFGGAAASLLSSGLGSAVVFVIAAPLAGIGVMQSFIIPMLPFLYWVVAIAGYFLLVIEAVVAVSLWALAHMRFDGEGISGDAGRYGWLMLLGLTLTPSLMILGYFAGMILFRVVAELFDAGMFYAMSALANASPIVAVFGLIASGALIVIAYLVILQRSFSLISLFPSRILHWIGSEAALSDGVSESRFQGSLQGMSSAMVSSVSKAGQLSMQGMRSMGLGKSR